MILVVVGTRPNFMKMAPIVFELEKNKIPNLLVHTGQHYDDNMSKNIMRDLKLRDPDHFLGVNPGSFANQSGHIMIEFEKICIKSKPKLILVAGDVNSTLITALIANKLNIPIGHVESGLRSFDKAMPEEINRILTDHISDLLFVSEKSGLFNLKNENIEEKRIHFVGNCMIDSLSKIYPRAEENKIWKNFNLNKSRS